ncbi:MULTISPECIES: 6-hydroxymethylpterin diphosphokinase MptE-like protein [unclassified Treponema]|uniref:6-hydroxymethylpterin diphosphokinase MptE-like protein n=1 Tax=unclassified Treponema TaxID=2638727 RepID=UPI0025F2B2F6|nr:MULTISPECIES: 6-hydroxymethylpterin diphosphokinase MptE-like protein [unclassified Treponema]
MIETEKPCLVKAGQGFSVLYKNRFLYSKYSPQKAIEQTVANLDILPQTLILCFSPCLWYGLKELLTKIPKDSLILGIEADKKLFELAEKKLNEIKKSCHQDSKKILLTSPSKIEALIKTLPHFRRTVSIEMSGGTFFYKTLYSQTALFSQNFIASFWKNRITLVKMGRLFCKNFFRNLREIPAEQSIPHCSPFFLRPFIVFGAGESTETFLLSVSKKTLQKCTVLAVDAALPVLLKHKIQPDFIIAVESQLAIEKAYIGANKTKAAIISDLASRPAVLRHTKGRHLYFYSEFSESEFLKSAESKGILPAKIPPLGSVGLTAVYLALFMRFDSNVPVFVTGLDFSYSLGFTHARGAPAHTARLISSNRFKPVENYDAAFKADAKTVPGKNGTVITDTALKNYAALFVNYFKDSKKLYDAGFSGLNLSLPSVTTEQIENFCQPLGQKKEGEFDALYEQNKKNSSSSDIKIKTKTYLLEEKNALLRIKELLSKGEKAAPAPTPNLRAEIENLLSKREYLYLHFPDGYRFEAGNLSFLKRISNEIDFFLKNFENL